MTKLTRLSIAQVVLLDELSEPNSNPDGAWYFPHGKVRTLACLERLGFAKRVDWKVHKVGYAITDAGMLRLGKTPRGGERKRRKGAK